MKQVIVAIMAIFLGSAVNTHPILALENASQYNPAVKKSSMTRKETSWSVFTKISQELYPRNDELGSFIENIPHSPEYSLGSTNQIARVAHATTVRTDSDVSQDVKGDYPTIVLPVLKQPTDNYKVLVAQAPTKARLTGNDELSHFVIYVVFPEDNGTSIESMPTVYFVNTQNATKVEATTEAVIILNQNRTVTGIKSKEIEKYISFRNKKFRENTEV